jgi:orotidine-5'-phosphate decarboxylase
MRLCSGAGPFKNWGALKNPLIVALDVPDENAALRLVEELADAVRFYKIGLQLFTRCGPRVVEAVKGTGAKVFLDLKFHDIPNTVRHSVESAGALGVDMLTIHLCGGATMIRAAADGARGSSALVLGVTVLTSSNRETLREVGIEAMVEDQVLRLARLATENGVGGIVASPLEVSLLRQVHGGGLTIVTPGVRPDWTAANDQQRTMTPKAAMQAGADYLVIGRPITAQPSPREAAERILDELI